MAFQYAPSKNQTLPGLNYQPPQTEQGVGMSQLPDMLKGITGGMGKTTQTPQNSGIGQAEMPQAGGGIQGSPWEFLIKILMSGGI